MASRRPRKPPAAEPAAELIPPRPTLPSVRKAAEDCRACELWEKGTQTVFGEGSKSARLMLIGEQPGDQEDKIGRPFVGPAGRILDRALEAAGIDLERLGFVVGGYPTGGTSYRVFKRLLDKAIAEAK